MGGQNKGAQHRLLFMLSLTTTFFLVEIIVGYFTNSMALVADSFHMLSDVVALVIAYISVLMSPKKWSKNTFGWARAEVLGALVNAVFLVALCFSILVESMKRFYKPEEIHQPNLILVVGFFGLLVNVIGLLLFKGMTKIAQWDRFIFFIIHSLTILHESNVHEDGSCSLIELNKFLGNKHENKY